MRKSKFKVISVALAVILLLSVIPFTATAEEVVVTGEDNLAEKLRRLKTGML